MTQHKTDFCYVVLATLLFCLPCFASEKPKTSVPPAPIPSQILSAKSAFISYAGVDTSFLNKEVTKFSGAPTGCYDQFYAAMKDWGRFQLVSAPADADLILEISILPGTNMFPSHYKLRILDPKTKIVLWTFNEDMELSTKDFDQKITKLVDDLRVIAVQPPTAAPNPWN